MNTKKQIVIEHLRGLADGSVKPRVYIFGICHEVHIICRKQGIHVLKNIVQELLSEHPEYSGNFKYPISHPNMSANVAYHVIKDLWDSNTEYGRTRREWCKWLADRLEEKYILGDKQ